MGINIKGSRACPGVEIEVIERIQGCSVLWPPEKPQASTLHLPDALRGHAQQLPAVRKGHMENRLRYGEYWEDSGFVFTDDLGHHLSASTVYKSFKKVMQEIGSPETRFHDLRHSYAVASIKSGDDIKTVQENLGHATAAFTLDVYGHVTEQMKKDSAARMERFIKAVNK